MNEGSFGDVLSGKKPIQFRVSIDTRTAFIFGFVIVTAIVTAYYFLKTVSTAKE